MPCQSNTTETPYAQLVLAASSFQELIGESEVSEQFAGFRELLWQFIEVSNDPNSHVIAWNMIDSFAKADLVEYQVTGNTDALDRLKYKVNHCLEFI